MVALITLEERFKRLVRAGEVPAHRLSMFENSSHVEAVSIIQNALESLYERVNCPMAVCHYLVRVARHIEAELVAEELKRLDETERAAFIADVCKARKDFKQKVLKAA